MAIPVKLLFLDKVLVSLLTLLQLGICVNTNRMIGAESVVIHLYSPYTMGKNLFHRAIVMSGSLGIAFKDQKEQLSVGVAFSKHIGCGMGKQN